MALGRSANPALNKNTFRDYTLSREASGTMTLNGTVNKVLIMLLLVIGTAVYTWKMYFDAVSPGQMSPPTRVIGWMIGGGVAGFIFALITIFKKTAARYTAPLYALSEGLFLGGISAIFEGMYPGIVIQAVGLTFGTLFVLLLAYKSGWIKVTENFKLGVVAATGGVFMIYLVSFILRLFGVNVGFIHEGSTFGIIFSLVVVGIAALNLVLDFDFIESGAEQGAPKYMEWYAAFGLIVTLVWLYLEMLRLLAKIASSRS